MHLSLNLNLIMMKIVLVIAERQIFIVICLILLEGRLGRWLLKKMLGF